MCSTRRPRILVVAIALGTHYRNNYANLFYKSQNEYCAKHGYDFIVIDFFIDQEAEHLSFISLQKTLVCSIEQAKQYDFVVYIDADVLINVQCAPPIDSEIKDPRLALFVDEYTQPSRLKRIEREKTMGGPVSASEYYKLSGLEIVTESVLNSGVMVLNPKWHKTLLEKVYVFGRRTGLNHPRGFHYEQSLVGYAFQRDQLFRLIDNKWNAILCLYETDSMGPSFDRVTHFRNFYRNNYFIHCAAHSYIGLEQTILELNGMQEGLPPVPMTAENQNRPMENSSPTSPTLDKSQSRNAPCPCGSGKRFKHCHGMFS